MTITGRAFSPSDPLRPYGSSTDTPGNGNLVARSGVGGVVRGSLGIETRSFAEGLSMKWMLVVLVGGVTPVQTDVLFEKLADCLAAEEQLRTAYADALESWDKRAVLAFDRRRDYARARQLQARKLDNSGTCIPHSGGDQPIASSRVSDQPASTSPTTPASPSR